LLSQRDLTTRDSGNYKRVLSKWQHTNTSNQTYDMIKGITQKISNWGPVGRTFFTIGLYLIVGICEIGGGWFIWQSMRDGKPFYYCVIGSIMLIMYGFLACFQILEFATAYATYGGFFIVMSLLWGWMFEKQVPQIQDVIGSVICIVGACIIAFVPRKSDDSSSYH